MSKSEKIASRIALKKLRDDLEVGPHREIDHTTHKYLRSIIDAILNLTLD